MSSLSLWLRLLMLLVFLGTNWGAAASQTSAPVARPLEPASSKPVAVPTFGWWAEPQCADDGSMYFHADTEVFNDSVILKLSPDASTYALYELDDQSSKDRSFAEFTVTPSGQVWLLTERRDGALGVFAFDSHGKAGNEVHIEGVEQLRPTAFAAFENGALLIGGYHTSNAPKAVQGKPFFALFEPSGKLRKNLVSPLPDVDPAEIGMKLREGGATLGQDGNLYVLGPKEVLVLSESGSIVRRIAFTKPDKAATARRIVVSQNAMALWLAAPGSEDGAIFQYLVLDRQNGDTIGLYVPHELGRQAICFSREDGFTFLRRNENEKMKLEFAPLR